MRHGHGIEQDDAEQWYTSVTCPVKGCVLAATHRHALPHWGNEEAAEQEHRYSPLVDALAIHARITDAHIEQTGGGVWAVVGTVAEYTLHADDYGYALTDKQGNNAADGAWYDDGRTLTDDVDTRALNPDECDAAAITFAAALPFILAGAQS